MQRLGERTSELSFPHEKPQLRRISPCLCDSVSRKHAMVSVAMQGAIDPSVETRDVRPSKNKPAPILRPAVQKVFECLTRGMTEKEIAEELHRSIHTIHNPVEAIYQEYGVKSKVELLFKVLPITKPE